MNKFLNILRRFQPQSRVDPVRDWFVLLIASGIIFIGLVVWNAWAFDTVASGGNLGKPAPKAVSIFDPAALDAVQKIIDARAEEEVKYRTGVYQYSDPSQ